MPISIETTQQRCLESDTINSDLHNFEEFDEKMK